MQWCRWLCHAPEAHSAWCRGLGHAHSYDDWLHSGVTKGHTHPNQAPPTSDPRRVDVGVQEGPESGCHLLLSWVRTVGMDVVVEGSWSALQSLNGQGSDDIGLLSDEVSTMRCLSSNGTDELGAIDQSKPL